MCRLVPLVLFLTVTIVGASQKPHFGLSLHYGTIAPHNKQMVRLITGHSYGVAAFCEWPTNMTKAWHSEYRYPSHRLDYIAIATGNPQQLGTQHALTYQLKLPGRRSNGKRFFLLGLGPGYSTKKWDINDNRQGFALGTHVNMALVLQYEGSLWTTAHHRWVGGIRITHLSNGAFAMPNAGTNTIGIHLGWQRHREPMPRPTPAVDSIPRFQWMNYGVMGFKEIQPPLSRKYPVYSLQQVVQYQLNRKSALVGQLDIMLNTSNPAIESKENATTALKNTSAQWGVAMGYQVQFGKAALVLEQGYYIYDKYKYDGTMYHRFGLRTTIAKRWYLQFALKTHFAKADHGELGFGYSLYRRGTVMRGGHK